MNRFGVLARLAPLLIVAGLLGGCNESEGGSASPTGLDLRGSWSGEYVRPGVREPLKAKVIQDGDAIIIQTSRQTVGRLLTGYMNSNADLSMTDGYDGELWTSATPATPNRIYLHDYLYSPTVDNDPPLQDIILTR